MAISLPPSFPSHPLVLSSPSVVTLKRPKEKPHSSLTAHTDSNLFSFFSCPVLKRLCHRWPQVKDISLAAPSCLVRFSSLSFINWWTVRMHLGLGCRTRPRTGFKRCHFKSNFVLSASGGSKITWDFIHNKSDAMASLLDSVPPGAEWRPPEEAATRVEGNRAHWMWMNIWLDLD